MLLRVIVSRLNGTESDRTVLDGSLALAKKFGAHIEVVFVTPDLLAALPPMPGYETPGNLQKVIKATQRDLKTRATKSRHRFEAWRARHRLALAAKANGKGGPSVAWREYEGEEGWYLGRCGRIVDLMVTIRPGREGVSEPGLEAALFSGGRPVLLLPPKATKPNFLGTVMVSWNGSAEAARAVKAAMPILENASRVEVLTIPEGQIRKDMGQDLIGYLAWHGIKARPVTLKDSKKPASESVLNAAKDRLAGLLVMGAYTHSRTREMIFGGVTRHVLTHAPLPVLMSH